MNIIGKWKDLWTNEDTGEISTSSGDFEFRDNQIQNDFCDLLALMCQTDPEGSFNGASFMACGSGESGWDAVPPTQSYDQSTLTNEIYRQATFLYFGGGEAPYYVNYWNFIDPIDYSPSVDATRAVETEAVVAAGDATGLHREFGIFGGPDATGSPDTGHMLNWVVIPVHDKLSGESLTRTIRLFFVER